MFTADFYPSENKLYRDNFIASMTNSMSAPPFYALCTNHFARVKANFTVCQLCNISLVYL